MRQKRMKPGWRWERQSIRRLGLKKSPRQDDRRRPDAMNAKAAREPETEEETWPLAAPWLKSGNFPEFESRIGV
jgi:hypothetical protein